MAAAIRIECHCPICIASASRLGKSALAAEITEDGVARLSKTGRLTKAAVHGIVYNANHPQIGYALIAHHTCYWAA